MRTRRSLLAAVVLLLVATGMAIDVRAEVAAETDTAGNYVRTVVLTSATNRALKIWSVERAWPHLAPLNPGGDLNGDLWPALAEDPNQYLRPWVVWSRSTGTDYDLAWSRWTPDGWTGTAWVEEPAAARIGDDLDPDLKFDGRGLALLVWWRNEGGTGRVYATAFQDVGWMPAFLVSDGGVDSRSPRITVLPDGRVLVAYYTPAGRVVRDLSSYVPLTITDDLDPFSRTATTSSSSVVPKSSAGH